MASRRRGGVRKRCGGALEIISLTVMSGGDHKVTASRWWRSEAMTFYLVIFSCVKHGEYIRLINITMI